MRSNELWLALGSVWQAAPRTPAVIDASGRVVDAGAMIDATARLARWIVERGADMVAILCDDPLRSMQVQLACWRAGATALVLPSFFVDEQLAHALAVGCPDLVATDAPSRVARLSDCAPGLQAPDGAPWCTGPGPAARLAGAAVVTFTSGSSGRPKGVGLSAATLLTVSRSLAQATGSRACQRHLALLHPAVLLETVGGSLRSWLRGGCVVLPPAATVAPGASGSLVLDQLRESAARSSIFMPATLDAVVSALEAGHEPAPLLRFVGVGGARVPVRLLERALQAGVPVREGYGLSECASVVTLDSIEAPRPGTQGLPLAHVRVTFAEDAELVVEGAAPVGLLGSPLPRGASPSRWATGDVGRLDDEGRLVLLGRKDNRFSTPGGRNVSPEWLEALLLEEPLLSQAVVLQAADGWPGAVLVPRTGATLDLEPLRERLAQRLPEHARLRHLLVADEPFSVSRGEWAATGRPVRRVIAERFGPLLHRTPSESPR